MSVYKKIGGFDKSAKNKAKMANERRRQSQMWLRRQAQQKKPPISTKDAPPCSH